MSPTSSTLRFITESIPSATVGAIYKFALQASGGRPSYSFQITEGSLPRGLKLSRNGIISGVTSDAADTIVFIKVRDKDRVTRTQAFAMIAGAD